MTILSESERKDKDSEGAYYEIDPGNQNDEVVVKDGKALSTWLRQRSNENVIQGFSFYYARHVFKDKYFILDEDLAPDPDNTGILGVIPESKNVMILAHVQTDYLDKGITKIVSAHYVTDQNLIEKYEKIKMYHKKFEEMMQ